MGIEAAEVGLEQLAQERVRAGRVAGLAEVVRVEDGVGVEVLGIVAGQHLLHLEQRAACAGDDRLEEVFDGVVGLAPVLLGGIPLGPENPGVALSRSC